MEMKRTKVRRKKKEYMGKGSTESDRKNAREAGTSNLRTSGGDGAKGNRKAV